MCGVRNNLCLVARDVAKQTLFGVPVGRRLGRLCFLGLDGDTAVQVTLPDGHPMLLKMGIHSGELASGVIGSLALRYRCLSRVLVTSRTSPGCRSHMRHKSQHP